MSTAATALVITFERGARRVPGPLISHPSGRMGGKRAA